jgi:hypothetical protein
MDPHTELLICCDGGVKNNNAGFGVAVTINEKLVLEIIIKLPPIYNHYTSHRAEAVGLLCAIQISQAINRYRILKINDLTPTMNTTIICDNKTVIDTSRQIELKKYYSPDFDIISNILFVLENIPPKNMILQHVKGHQTSKTNQLPFKAQLNNYTDSLATKALLLPTKETITWEQFPRAVLYIDNKPVTANHDAIIRKNFLSTHIRNYYQTKYSWDNTTIENIWWMTHEKALYKQSPGILIFIQKYIHDKLLTNQRQHLFYSYKSNLCSACNQEEETIETTSETTILNDYKITLINSEYNHQ